MQRMNGDTKCEYPQPSKKRFTQSEKFDCAKPSEHPLTQAPTAETGNQNPRDGDKETDPLTYPCKQPRHLSRLTNQAEMEIYRFIDAKEPHLDQPPMENHIYP